MDKIILPSFIIYILVSLAAQIINAVGEGNHTGTLLLSVMYIN